ncbi:MAG: hypothetical protein A2648_01510 [Candidatus Lloydbacteria bacterium RIFCSPHIGHO2_01_FULL_41_20]|uniref:DUF1761 domain-containing protein n=1 Tax=Candidatus Lloydbacteria bacterium RIFCSPHIGHO2_01_FULL_41_20 TaxID=1798657 RepID=A0A1G2CSZ0_9BACT|nr:MAG: hypothetical protein A2648_01510 [Candidatus Lloydbacteria bacterium RIFCSPHIGHO2_01_FULL_41_20]
MSDINIFPVIAATIISFIVGSVWHGPLFGKQWMALSGFTEDRMKKMPLSASQAMVLGFISTLVLGYVISYFVHALGVIAISGALILGLWVWVGFILTTLANTVLWEGRPPKLFVFNLAYALINIWIMTVVLTLWQ